MQYAAKAVNHPLLTCFVFFANLQCLPLYLLVTGKAKEEEAPVVGFQRLPQARLRDGPFDYHDVSFLAFRGIMLHHISSTALINIVYDRL